MSNNPDDRAAAPVDTSWFRFYVDGAHVGWQQLTRRVVAGAPGPGGSSEPPDQLLRREVLTVFHAGDSVHTSAFFAEAPEGDPLAWRRFGTLTPSDAGYVEGQVFRREGDQLSMPDGSSTALPPVCYPGQLLLELAMARLRSGQPSLEATPLHDGDGSLEAPTNLRVVPALIGPPGVTHRFDELPTDGGPARRSILLAPDGRPMRQVWGPGTWCGASLTREQAQANGPAAPGLGPPD